MKGEVTGWIAALSQVIRSQLWKDSYGGPMRGPQRVGGREGVSLELRPFLGSLHSREEGRVQG